MSTNKDIKSTRKPPLKKISANEINRYVYCPYQWYYGKYYGQTKLKEQYKALNTNNGQSEHNFARGINFHKDYYKQYQRQRILKLALIFIVLVIIIRSIVIWCN